jgi:hypothetical protein
MFFAIFEHSHRQAVSPFLKQQPADIAGISAGK